MKLHIGSRVRTEGWKTLDIQEGPGVDYVGNCSDLSRFPRDCIETIYASHVLEHISYMGQVSRTLEEWFRVLTPGGILMISVPDFDILARMFTAPVLDINQRFQVMRMAFGGAVDEHDVHRTGFTFEFLESFLKIARFTNIQRVEQFGLFQDASAIKLYGVHISLNVTAQKPPS